MGRSDFVIMPERNRFSSFMSATTPDAVSGDSSRELRGEVRQLVSLAVYGRQARERRFVIGRVVWYLVVVGHWLCIARTMVCACSVQLAILGLRIVCDIAAF